MFKFDNHHQVRSPDLTRLMVGKPLTDRRIAYYAARGRYGPEYKEEQKKRTKRKKNPTLAAIMKEFT